MGRSNYIPHRPVVRTDKNITKIRAVFYALCAVKGRPSLNDCLHQGPNLLARTFDVMLRFCFNKIGVIADIEKAFLNIEISEEHRDFLRFLWFDVSSEDDYNFLVFRFAKVVFGVTSSPFLLNGTIRHHLNKYVAQNLQLIAKLLRDIYVDDVLSGVETVEEGLSFYCEVKKIMLKAGFNLRKWITNSQELENVFGQRGGCCE